MAQSAKPLVVATAGIASLLEILDISIVNVAIPWMQGNLGVTIDQVAWVATGYIISNAVVLPIAGWLGDRIGRRKYFTSCILLFTLTSVLCGLAPSFGWLVFFRVLQGAFGGALLPTSQTIIQEQFPGEKSGIGSAIYGMSVMIGPALGPIIGGVLTDRYGWRSIFFVNLPVGLIAAALSVAVIGDVVPDEAQKRRPRGRIDLIGFALLILGVGGLQFMLERGQSQDWFSSGVIVAAAAIAGICLPIFYAYEYRHPDPIVDVKLFNENPVRWGTLLMTGLGMIVFAIVFLIPFYTDRILHMDAKQTGLLYLPGSIITMFSMPIIGVLLPKTGAKPLLFLGAILIASCLDIFSHFTTSVGYWNIILPLVLRGVGLACLFVPINSAVLGQFTGSKLAQAAGLLNLLRQVGGSIGIAGMSTFLDRFGSQFRNDLRPWVGPANPAAQFALRASQAALHARFPDLRGIAPASVGTAPSAVLALQAIQGRIEEQVFQLSFNRLMVYVFAGFAILLFAIYRIKVPKFSELAKLHDARPTT